MKVSVTTCWGRSEYFFPLVLGVQRGHWKHCHQIILVLRTKRVIVQRSIIFLLSLFGSRCSIFQLLFPCQMRHIIPPECPSTLMCQVELLEPSHSDPWPTSTGSVRPCGRLDSSPLLWGCAQTPLLRRLISAVSLFQSLLKSVVRCNASCSTITWTRPQNTYFWY